MACLMERAEVRVVVVDDSLLMRELLQSALTETGDIDVVGAAANPYEAREVIRATNPDVVTLDVEMPGMSGLEFLRRIMQLRPTPVVMVAGSTTAGAETTLAALEISAVDFVSKPVGRAGWIDFAATVRHKVRAAASIRLNRHAVPACSRAALAQTASTRQRLQPPQPTQYTPANPGRSPAGRPPMAQRGADPHTAPAPAARSPAFARCDLIAIGASTGGVTAINRLLAGLPRQIQSDRERSGTPPIVIAQHMPPDFTARFADRLARSTGLDVAEASDGEALMNGMIRIAPGDRHLRVARQGDRLICLLGEDDLVNGHRPSVDVLFTSVATALRARAVGVILTGMGSDGANGLTMMRAAGAHTLGEAESSCTVYGMPKAAMQMGAVAEELEIGGLAERLRGALTDAGAAPEITR